MRPADRAAERDRRLRHRPDRPLRVLRRHLAHLVDRRRNAARRHARRPCPRLRADRLEHGAPRARHRLRGAARPRLRPARAVPCAALLLHLARGRALRRVALHRLSRGSDGRSVRRSARARHGALRREPGQPGRRRLLDQARGAGAGRRNRARRRCRATRPTRPSRPPLVLEAPRPFPYTQGPKPPGGEDHGNRTDERQARPDHGGRQRQVHRLGHRAGLPRRRSASSPSPTRARRSASGCSRSPPRSAPTSCCPATSPTRPRSTPSSPTLAERWGRLDFLVHAIGFSDKNELRGSYTSNTTAANFTQTMLISVYSFTAAAQRAEKLMPEGGSLPHPHLLRRREGDAALQRHGRRQGGAGGVASSTWRWTSARAASG